MKRLFLTIVLAVAGGVGMALVDLVKEPVRVWLASGGVGVTSTGSPSTCAPPPCPVSGCGSGSR